MTPKEAAEHLSSAFKWTLDNELKEAIQLAIQALEENQQPEIVPIGTKVRVTKREYTHYFDIGDIVTVNDFPKLPYSCQNEDGMIQWLSRKEFEIIEQ